MLRYLGHVGAAHAHFSRRDPVVGRRRPVQEEHSEGGGWEKPPIYRNSVTKIDFIYKKSVFYVTLRYGKSFAGIKKEAGVFSRTILMLEPNNESDRSHRDRNKTPTPTTYKKNI